MRVDPDGDFALPAIYYAGAAAIGAATWLTTPQGKQAVKDLANELGTSMSVACQQIEVLFAKGNKQHIRDSGLADRTDKEIQETARDKSIPKAERQRAKKEEKARGLRGNSQTSKGVSSAGTKTVKKTKK